VVALLAPRRADTHKQDFVYGQGIDEIVMLEQADVLDHDDDQDTSELTRHFCHRNALGSVLEITDMLEAKAVTYRYDPYGAVTITVGGTPQGTDPLNQHWTFTGRFFDEETGFYYYRARMYDPATGRFLQRDPLGYEVGPSLYAYVTASPATWRDPCGTDLWDDFCDGLESLAQNIHDATRGAVQPVVDAVLSSVVSRGGAGACICELTCQYVEPVFSRMIGDELTAEHGLGLACTMGGQVPPECIAECDAIADAEQARLHNDLHTGYTPVLFNPATGLESRWTVAPKLAGASFRCDRTVACR
jgi:RHS repeat-associated protein